MLNISKIKSVYPLSKPLCFVLATVAFFLYILFFSIIYAFVIPWDFYHSNTKLEKDYEISERKVMELANKAVGKNFLDHHTLVLNSGGKAFEKCKSPKEADGHVYSLAVKRDLVLSSPETSLLSLRGQIYCEPIEPVKTLIDTTTVYELHCVVGPMAWDVEERGSPGYYISCDMLDSKTGELNDLFMDVYAFNYEECRYLYRFVEHSNGLPEGLFLRMVYFSAVTATTLGYGDIAPITNRARIIVAFQSVMALLLIGVLGVWITRRDK
jgi:hypothetical protein